MTEPLSPGDNLHVRPVGPTIHVGPERLEQASDRLDEALRVAELAGAHVWVALTAYLITDPTGYADGTEGLLDVENLVSANIGCYRCEEPLSARLIHRRCPGQPRA